VPGIRKPGACPFIFGALFIPGSRKPKVCPFILVAYLIPYEVFLL
jgi:hypothetical protein